MARVAIKVRKLTNLPGFLKGVSVTKKDIDDYIDKLSCWASMLHHANGASESELLKMMHVELATKCRMPVLYRLRSRFNTERRRREVKELEAYAEKI